MKTKPKIKLYGNLSGKKAYSKLYREISKAIPVACKEICVYNVPENGGIYVNPKKKLLMIDKKLSKIDRLKSLTRGLEALYSAQLQGLN